MAGGGLLGGGGMKGQIADIVIEVFDRYDIEPGELNEKMNDTIELVRELAPVIKQVEEISEDLDNDVETLRDDLGKLQETTTEFNKNSSELAVQLERTADAFENFNQIVEEAVEEADNDK